MIEALRRLWHRLRGFECRFCHDRIKWPALELHRWHMVCGDCRRDTFAWLAEMGGVLTLPKGE